MSKTQAHDRGVRRSRRCENCGQRFETFERISAEDYVVEKRDGTTEKFSKTKLRRSIEKAAAVHALSAADVDAFVERIISRLHPAMPGTPIPATKIARVVLQQLQDGRSTTDVARIRFAIASLGQTTRRAGFRSLPGFLDWLEDEYGPPPAKGPTGTPVVLKRDGHVESFELDKLRDSIVLAAKGRGTDEAVRQLATTVAAETLREIRMHGVVTSQHVATEALKLLFHRDALAYLRYASDVKRYRSHEHFWTDALALEAANRAGADGAVGSRLGK